MNADQDGEGPGWLCKRGRGTRSRVLTRSGDGDAGSTPMA